MEVKKLDSQKNGVTIEAFMKEAEWKELSGHLNNLVAFPANSISSPTKAIRTGARHNCARYFLVPVSLRKAFKADSHDLENIKCGCVKNDGKLFVIFRLDIQEVGKG